MLPSPAIWCDHGLLVLMSSCHTATKEILTAWAAPTAPVLVFCTKHDAAPESVISELPEVRPTIACSTPSIQNSQLSSVRLMTNSCAVFAEGAVRFADRSTVPLKFTVPVSAPVVWYSKYTPSVGAAVVPG